MRNPDRLTRFSFKQFEMSNCRSAMKIGTDGVLLGAWAIGTPISRQSDEELRIMDVGSGTGLIALMLAQRFPEATIVGVECDRDAAEEGADNFAGSPWHENLQMVHADFNTIAQESTSESLDAVVSNPPFFTNGAHAPDMQRLAARHEGTLNHRRSRTPAPPGWNPVHSDSCGTTPTCGIRRLDTPAASPPHLRGAHCCIQTGAQGAYRFHQGTTACPG